MVDEWHNIVMLAVVVGLVIQMMASVPYPSALYLFRQSYHLWMILVANRIK